MEHNLHHIFERTNLKPVTREEKSHPLFSEIIVIFIKKKKMRDLDWLLWENFKKINRFGCGIQL